MHTRSYRQYSDTNPAAILKPIISVLWLVLASGLFLFNVVRPALGKTLFVGAGDNLQQALNIAMPGDTIVLTAGAHYAGPFTLPYKTGSQWIMVRSSAAGNDDVNTRTLQCHRANSPQGEKLPPPGCRVDPTYAAMMPHLDSEGDAVIRTAPGAHHFQLVGLDIGAHLTKVKRHYGQLLRTMWAWYSSSEIPEFVPVATVGINLVILGYDEKSIATQPHHIVISRCYIHGDPEQGARRGVALNSRDSDILDSYFSDFKEAGTDSQAIAGWNGAGPFHIINNYLEAAGENLMFGGADPTITGLVPANITIRQNHFAKPLSWRHSNAEKQFTSWTIKNLFELKNARSVVVDGNLFEYNWPQAQDGFAILFTVRNQSGSAPWSVVENVVFSNNIVRHVANGIYILGQDNNYPSQQTRHITIRNNLFDDIGGRWRGGRLFQILDASADVTIQHNTAMQTDSILVGGERLPHSGFVFTDNIAPHNNYGIIATGKSVGLPSLQLYFPGSAVHHNVMIGGPAAVYPSPNYFPNTRNRVGFVNESNGDYRLRDSSPYRHSATDGGDIGVDFKELCGALMSTDTSEICSTIMP